MPYVKLFAALSYTDNQGVETTWGSVQSPIKVNAASDVKHVQTFSVAAAGTQELFDVADDIADFDFLMVISDKDSVVLQLVTDDDNSIGERAYTVQLAAGVPFILASKRSYANFTVDFAGGTLDNIERMNVKNLQATDAAKVTLLAFT